MRNARELMPRAVAAVVAAVEAVGAGALERSTPCRAYDVRGLVNHFAGTTAWLERMGRRAAPDADDPFGVQQDVTSGEWEALLVERVRDVGAAWADPAAWEGGEIEGASMPARCIGEMALVELLFHGWDLAVASGQRPDIDEDVAAAALGFVTETGEMGRQNRCLRCGGPGAGGRHGVRPRPRARRPGSELAPRYEAIRVTTSGCSTAKP